MLVVDDHKPNLMLLRQQLDYLGQRVIAADSGEAALALWREHAFDVVITDYSVRLHGFGADGRSAALPRRRHGRLPVQADRRGRLAATLERSRGTGRAPHAPSPQAAAPATDDATPTAFSAESILALTQNDEALIRQLLEEVIRTNRADVDQLQKLHQQADWPKVSDMAHRLAGGARVVDAKAMIDTVLALEKKRKARLAPHPKSTAWYVRLRRSPPRWNATARLAGATAASRSALKPRTRPNRHPCLRGPYG